MKKKVTAAILTGMLAIAMAGICSSAPECKVGSVKAERGKVYYCRDSENPHWVKE